MNPNSHLPDQWFRPILDQLTTPVVIESNGDILFVNHAYASLLDYQSAELVLRPIADVIHDQDRDRLAFFARRRSEGKQAPSSYVFAALRRDGLPASVEASVSTCIIGKRLLITTVIHNQLTSMLSLSSLTPALAVLGPREREVFDHFLASRRPKEVAFLLGISEKTVATHRARIFEKLALRNDLDFIRFAVQHRLMPT